MTSLQEAIDATRSGNHIEAQKILADILKSDNENTQAWYLLPLLVDCPEKKEAYLNRVLALDPMHEKAQEELAASIPAPTSTLTDSEPVIEGDTAVSPTAKFEDPSDFSSDTIDSNLPSWLESDNPTVSDDMLVEEEPSEIFNSELPDWLSSESAPIDVLDEPPTLPSAMAPSNQDDDTLTLDEPDEQVENVLEDESEDLSLELEHADSTDSLNETDHSHLEEPADSSSVRVWNILLFLLTLLALITLIAIALQLINIF